MHNLIDIRYALRRSGASEENIREVERILEGVAKHRANILTRERDATAKSFWMWYDALAKGTKLERETHQGLSWVKDDPRAVSSPGTCQLVIYIVDAAGLSNLAQDGYWELCDLYRRVVNLESTLAESQKLEEDAASVAQGIEIWKNLESEAGPDAGIVNVILDDVVTTNQTAFAICVSFVNAVKQHADALVEETANGVLERTYRSALDVVNQLPYSD